MFESIAEAVFFYAEKTPDALFAADSKRSYTYLQAKNAAIGAAAQLASLGVKKGDRVMVECTQNVPFCVTQLALAVLGAVFVPYDRKISPERKSEMIREANPVCFAGINRTETNFAFFSLDSIDPVADPIDFPFKFPRSSDCSELLYSTGTTGKSKGIHITHGNNIALAQNVSEGVGMESGNVELVPVSLSHSHGLRTLYANFYRGNAVVIASGVTFLKPLFGLMERYHVTAVDLVPSAWRILCGHGAEQLVRFRDQIRYVQLGSAPLTEDDKKSLRELLPNSRLYNFYGSTESGRTCTYDFAAYPGKVNCIGKPVGNAEVLIVDGDHRIMNESSADQTGYLAFRGPMNMSGYWENPELTAEVLRDGIFYTRDVGYTDAEGWVYLLGRDDDIINFGGVKINPVDIEEIVRRCSGVVDCGCIGHSDPVSGQSPWLFVQLAPDAGISMEKVSEWIKSNVDREKMPKKILEIRELPKTSNGKLLRRVLKEIAADME